MKNQQWLVTYRYRTEVCPLTYGVGHSPLIRRGESVLDVILQVMKHYNLPMFDLHSGAIQFHTTPYAKSAEGAA